MRKYIILRANITGMGGAQMYVRNKIIYERNKGNEAFVFSSRDGDIIIEDLKHFSHSRMSELNLSPLSYTAKSRENIIWSILNRIQYRPNDEVFVESNDVVMSLWGELIAKQTNAKHLVFILNENYSKEERHYTDFYVFKHERKEIAGINKTSLPKLFEGCLSIGEKDAYWLDALCSNVVDDCENPVLNELKPGAVKICSIGRLNKGYVKTMCDEILKFTQLYSNISFQVIFVGDSPENKDKEYIDSCLKKSKNASYLVTGYMFPIPRKLFPEIDVFVSCAGSTRSSFSERRPTISIDGNTGLAIGVLGYDTVHTLYARDDDVAYPIHEALEKVLIQNVPIVYTDAMTHTLKLLDTHDVFLKNSSDKKEYFNVLQFKRTKKESLFWLMNLILGTRISSGLVYPELRKMLEKR